jgi:hypothetical protein
MRLTKAIITAIVRPFDIPPVLPIDLLMVQSFVRLCVAAGEGNGGPRTAVIKL